MLNFFFYSFDIENAQCGKLKGFVQNGTDRNINLIGNLSNNSINYKNYYNNSEKEDIIEKTDIDSYNKMDGTHITAAVNHFIT